jgi:hypothetical protein
MTALHKLAILIRRYTTAGCMLAVHEAHTGTLRLQLLSASCLPHL